jgi:hypothetical protein
MIEGKRRGEQLKLRGCSPEDFREIAAAFSGPQEGRSLRVSSAA